jgi:FkbH-like protein
MWYAAKVPYAASVFTAAAEDIVSALAATSGLARKVIVLDLDNTLWGGVVGEVGWRHVHLGGHHHLGEAFVDFQRVLKGMSRRGIQLVIASKNDESVALEAIDRHPDMILRRDDFATWRIDWRDKATNIQSMAQELNLGTSSFVFIDDNPSERGRVREQLPEVLVPDWPVDPTRYVQAFRALRCFDTIALSDEDLARSSMYAAERARRREAEMFADGGDWLASLGVTVHANRLTSDDLSRAAQLLNKTNQLNLATRRLSEVELMDWATQPGQEVWTFRVDDRFGPSGLTGLLGLRHEANETTIVDFLLSCRVMGRKVEEAMLHVAWRRANANGSTALRAQYFETERNGPCLQCFRASGLSETEPHLFSWDVSRSYAQPKTVTIQGLSDHVDDA